MLSEFDKIIKKGLAHQVLTPPAYAIESVEGWRTWSYAVRDTIEELTAQRDAYEVVGPSQIGILSDLNYTPITDDWDGVLCSTIDSDFNINIT